MAETVGQHSVAAFTSPVNGTTPIDANSVRGNDNTMRSAYVDHDADPGIHVQSSTLASRPVAGTAGRKWVTVSSGRYQFWYDDGTRWHEIASDAINVDCLADANLAKGDVVKITGFNNGQNLPTVNKVTASTDVAFGIVENTVTSGNIVQIVNTGLIEDVDTNGYAVGTILYPNTSGGWTTTKPTSGNYQPAGFVLRGNTNNGVLYVEFSAPRIVERSNNEASTIVLRDASGNFAAGTITAGAVTSTGLVTFASLKGTGATTVTNILDEDNMASDSATALATQQSIKAYVDTKVATVDTLAEVLANGNTTGATDIIVTAGQKITTDTIAETTAAAGVTIDSVLLKDNAVTATTFNGTLNGAAPAGSLSGTTLASNVVSSSLTSVGTLANLTVTNPITGSVTGSSGSTTGNAATATALQTARNINGVSFNGTADITVTAAAGTLTGTTLASNVLASSLTSVGTLSSLTVSGDLTVDTSTLKVDSANNRVGIGTATPGFSLDATASGAVVGNFNRTTSSGATVAVQVVGNTVGTLGSDTGGNGRFDISSVSGGVASNSIQFSRSGGTVSMLLDSSGNLAVDTNTLYVDAANNRVGIGTASPVARLTVNGETRGIEPTLGTTEYYLGMSTNGVYLGTDAAKPVYFITNATERMYLDASGNLGLGVTPSAWSGLKGLQVADSTMLAYAGTNGYVGSNSYYGSAGGSGFKYYGNGLAALYAQEAGVHKWFNAPNNTSGAGAAISFTQAMTLDASGNLLMGQAASFIGTNTADGADSSSLTISGGGGATTTRGAYVGMNGNESASAGNIEIASGNVAGSSLELVARSSTSPILFYAGGITERARITSGGYFKASNTGAYNSATGAYHELRSDANATVARVQSLIASGYTDAQLQITFIGYTPNAANAWFLFCDDTTNQKAGILSTGTFESRTSTYGGVSDVKLKQDIVDAASQWDDVKAVRVRKFRFKDEPDSPLSLGVVAQEIEQVSPGLVYETPDYEEQEVTDEDGNVTTEKVQVGVTKSVKYSILYMKSVKALQEAMARIEALEARLEALEA